MNGMVPATPRELDALIGASISVTSPKSRRRRGESPAPPLLCHESTFEGLRSQCSFPAAWIVATASLSCRERDPEPLDVPCSAAHHAFGSWSHIVDERPSLCDVPSSEEPRVTVAEKLEEADQVQVRHVGRQAKLVLKRSNGRAHLGDLVLSATCAS